jgi:hypothetical protein
MLPDSSPWVLDTRPWLQATCRLPYHQDPDYRDSLVNSIKQQFGNVPVDITYLESWGSVDVALGYESMDALFNLPLIGQVRTAVDREMFLGTRTVV